MRIAQKESKLIYVLHASARTIERAKDSITDIPRSARHLKQAASMVSQFVLIEGCETCFYWKPLVTRRGHAILSVPVSAEGTESTQAAIIFLLDLD